MSEGGYEKIPNVLSRRGGGTVRLLEVAVYCYMASLNPCFPSNKGIAITLGLNRRTVARCVSALKRDGWIELLWVNGKRYALCRHSHEARYRAWFEDARAKYLSSQGCALSAQGGVHSVRTNKTRFNKTKRDAHASRRPEAVTVGYSGDELKPDPEGIKRVREILGGMTKAMPKP